MNGCQLDAGYYCVICNMSHPSDYICISKIEHENNKHLGDLQNFLLIQIDKIIDNKINNLKIEFERKRLEDYKKGFAEGFELGFERG